METSPARNSAPVAADDAFVTYEGDTINWWYSLLENDTDVDAGDVRTIVSVDTTGTRGQVVLDAANQLLTYTASDAMPASGGYDSFTYTIADAEGLQSTARVWACVHGANDAPVAADDALWFQEDMVINWWHTLLNNDRDPDMNDSLSIVSVDTTGTAGHVVYDAATEQLTYKAAAMPGGVVAVDSFTYTVADIHGAQSTATVSIEVHGLNDAPVAADDRLAVWENGGLNWWTTLLHNDIDPDGYDTGRIVSVDTSGMDGELIFDPANQVLIYNGPDALRQGEGGEDSFTYTMADEHGVQSTATVKLLVTGQNDAPIANHDEVVVTAGDATENLWSALLGNDRDADADDVRAIMQVDTAGTLGTVAFDGATGLVRYSADTAAFAGLAPGEARFDSFSYAILDSSGAVSDYATVAITVYGEMRPGSVIDFGGRNGATFDDGQSAAFATIDYDVAANDTMPMVSNELFA